LTFYGNTFRRHFRPLYATVTESI